MIILYLKPLLFRKWIAERLKSQKPDSIQQKAIPFLLNTPEIMFE